MKHQPCISVVLGNIVRQPDCDAVVNAANKNLRAGSGVCGAIYDAAGPLLEPFSVKLAPLAVGEAVATPAFDLGGRYIIHTLGPKYRFDEDPVGNLSRAARSAILLADENEVKRLAMPAISTGVYGFPAEEAVPIIVKAANETLGKLKSIEEIRFVVTSNLMLALFKNALQSN
ncbi:MAG: macro domain-containing protein [Fluviibacter phosphoraccumulans]